MPDTLVRNEPAQTRVPPRFEGVVRPYSPEDVLRLRGSVKIEHTLAEMGARRLWELLHTEDYVQALGALTGNQAVQMVRAGLQASTSRAGRSRPTPTARARPTPTRASTPWTAFPRWCAASTAPSCARTRSSTRKGRAGATGSPPSWPTPRPASAAP